MKGPRFLKPSNSHDECWQLLPWLANERAQPADMAKVEAHLRECTQCQGELEAQRQLREAIRAQEAVVLAPQTSLQKLLQRIDAVDEAEDETVGSVNEGQPGAAPPSGATERPWRWLRIAAAVQGIAIAGLLTALWWQSHETLVAPRFTTLSTHPAVPRGPVLRVVFAKDIALDEVGDMLRSIDAQIIAGPSDARVYTLALAESHVDPAATQAALLRLRADQRVLFAEQAVARSGPP